MIQKLFKIDSRSKSHSEKVQNLVTDNIQRTLKKQNSRPLVRNFFNDDF